MKFTKLSALFQPNLGTFSAILPILRGEQIPPFDREKNQPSFEFQCNNNDAFIEDLKKNAIFRGNREQNQKKKKNRWTSSWNSVYCSCINYAKNVEIINVHLFE